jgi:hypothetical protein
MARDNAEMMGAASRTTCAVCEFHECDHSYKVAINKFRDITEEEVSAA